MGIDKIKKSNRLLQSRRYTQENLNDAQEAFSRVLDLNASEIFIDQNLVPYVDLPFSGSSQSGSIFTSGSKDIAKYYYRHPLTPATTASSFYEVWFFLDPTSSVAVDPQIIQPDQQFNFISPKYSSASLTLSETEAPTPGYNVVIYTGSSMTQILAGSGKKVSANDYQFDYKTGILQFGSNPPPSTAFVTITAYQYLGDTLDEFISSGGGGSGTGFPFSGSAVITGSLLISGSNVNELVVSGNVIATQGFTGSLSGNATSATSATNAEQAQTVYVEEINDNQDYYLPFTNAINNSYGNLYQDRTGSFVYNPLLNTLRIGGITNGVTTGSIQLTGSINMLSGSITLNSGSFIGTSSWALQAVSASVAQNISPTLFNIPVQGATITGSGIVISSSTALPANTYNAIRIGDAEIYDNFTFNGSPRFAINVPNSLYILSGSVASGSIATLAQNSFDFFERWDVSVNEKNFSSDKDEFIIYKSQSNNDVATTAFRVNRQTGSLYISGGASISGSATIQKTLTVGGASTLDSLTVTNNATVSGNATITGNLTVNGTTTYINVDNLLVEDKFILLNSGSTGTPSHEGGIIVQTTSSGGTAYGTALYYDQEANRWVVNRSSSVAWNATSNVFSTSSDFIVTVTGSAGVPTGTPVNFGTGDSLNSIG
jgi:hypothetical protein